MLHIRPQDVGASSIEELTKYSWSLAFGDLTSDLLRQDIIVGQRHACFQISQHGLVRRWRIRCGDRVVYEGATGFGLVYCGDRIDVTINWGEPG